MKDFYYSQSNQDLFLNKKVFSEKKQGYFVEIGAYDGITGSNTYFFEKRGWNGICIEPLPTKFKLLKKSRKAKAFQYCVGEKKGIINFTTVLNGEMLSTISKKISSEHYKRIKDSQYKTKEIKVPIAPFEFFIPKSISEIDYISIDVEGAELEVLKTINFGKRKIHAISVEDNYLKGEVDSILVKKGFLLIWCNTFEKIFIHKRSRYFSNSFILRNIYCKIFIKLFHLKNTIFKKYINNTKTKE